MKLLLTLLVTWSISSLTFSETTVTILADQSYAPYSYLENGVLKGAYIDIIKAASAELDEYQVDLKAAKWSKALEQVEQGEVLALVPPYHKPKLRPFIHPYSVAIITEKLVIVADKNKITDSMTWPQSFSGWTIGRNSGFAFGKEIEESGQVTFAEAPKMATNLIRLAKGKIDGYANDELSIFYTLKKLSKRACIQRLELLLKPPQLLVKRPVILVTPKHSKLSGKMILF